MHATMTTESLLANLVTTLPTTQPVWHALAAAARSRHDPDDAGKHLDEPSWNAWPDLTIGKIQDGSEAHSPSAC